MNVHVRLLVEGQVYVPAFNVTYTANGTQRVAVNGEDSLEYVMPVGLPAPTVTLAFPQAVNNYTLVNSTTLTVALTGVDDVWIYYAGAQQAPPPPPPPPPPPGGGGGGGGETPPEQPSQPQPPQPPQPEQPQPQQPSLAERIRQWFVWAAEWIAKWLERLWPWWLLLLLALVALLVYLWWRKRKRFVLIIEV
jgi:U5 snRNP spliceosome subunit